MSNYTPKTKIIQEADLPDWVEWKKVRYVIQADRVIDEVALSWDAKAHIRNLKAEEKAESGADYINLKTGELKNYMPKTEDGSHMRNRTALYRTFKEVRQLITTNFSGMTNEQFITLTYKENMTDGKQFYEDFKKFMKKLYYKYPNEDLQYIAIVEPQGRGAWHVHLLLKAFNKLAFFPDYHELNEMWGHGRVWGEHLEHVDSCSFGSYFYAYFSNVEINDMNKGEYELRESDIVEKNGKKYIKGERLDMYPDYMKIVRTSRGIVKPTVAERADTNDYYCNFESITKTEMESSELYIKKRQYKKKK